METTTLWPFEIGGRTVILLLALTGCDPGRHARPEVHGRARPLATAPGSDEITFESGGGTRARVTRRPAADGSESLHGETEIALGPQEARCIVEDVALDPQGRLVQAEVTAAPSCGAEPDARAHLDPSGGDPSERAPWIYTPELLPGRAVATPVAAWVAFRAAGLSSELTLVQLEKRRAWQVPSDQIAVPTELGTTVVLGNDGADVGAVFVNRVGLADVGATLVCVGRTGEPTI
jgi:hypothetical protein